MTHKDLLDLRNRSADPYEASSTFRNSAEALLDRIRKKTEVKSLPAPPPSGTPPESPDEAAVRDLEADRDAQIEAVRSSGCDAHQIEGEIDYITQTCAEAIAEIRRGDR